jgi:hypothetical protein
MLVVVGRVVVTVVHLFLISSTDRLAPSLQADSLLTDNSLHIVPLSYSSSV